MLCRSPNRSPRAALTLTKTPDIAFGFRHDARTRAATHVRPHSNATCRLTTCSITIIPLRLLVRPRLNHQALFIVRPLLDGSDARVEHLPDCDGEGLATPVLRLRLSPAAVEQLGGGGDT